MTKITLGINYETLRSNLRGYYAGKGWHRALHALDLGLKHHNGLRKNGEPEFSHQVFQCQAARTMDTMFIDPEGTHCTILLHDIREDHNYPLDLLLIDYGTHVTKSVQLMTNVNEQNTDKEEQTYYEDMIRDPRASLAKGFDRQHNILSMIGTFTDEKQKRYIDTTRKYIVPMLKNARKQFPQQEPVYQNIKVSLLSTMFVIEKIHEAKELK